MWDIRSFSRLQSLTLTFTRYYSRYRGTRLVSIWLDQGFKSYVMYCTVLYCTVLYCNEKICQYIGNHSGNDYFGFITGNILEINNRGDSRINEGKRGG